MAQCGSCKKTLANGEKFCPDCGKPLKMAKFESPSAPTATAGLSSWTSTASTIEGRFDPGTLLAGRYRIVGRLGKGGMGEVYRADDMKLGQPVALKFLPESFMNESATLARFHHEVKITREISHPNVCRVYDISEYEGQHFLSMEYVDGEDLRSLLRRIGRLSGDKALQIARQLCAGLAAAHDKGVLHRDLKPANIMLDGSGRVRITDFGLAAVAGEVQEADLKSGTPAYMAPEQRAGREVSAASDIYTLGLVLFELFTGKAAYAAASRVELEEKQLQDVTSPSSLAQEIDPVVERVILGCLARHPAERPSSVLAVAAALPGGDPLGEALAAGETPSPEMVAASTVKGGLRPILAWTTLVGIVVCATLLFLLAGKGNVTSHAALTKGPQVLIAGAQKILADVGHDAEPADFLWGFTQNDKALDHFGDLDSSDRWEALGERENSSVLFFYRQSPVLLEPNSLVSNRMNLRDPPPTTPGMATVTMDTEGRLVRMEVLPPERDESEALAAANPDWQPLLAAAGIDAETLRPVEPVWNPLLHCDHRVAWEVTGDQPICRLEAAAYRGKPVYFRILAPWDKPFDPDAQSMSTGEWMAQTSFLVLAVVVLVGGFLLARRNLRLGRSDLRGAFRIATVFVLIHMLAWLLYAKHLAAIDLAFFATMMTLARTFFEALLIYTLYLALEPYIRRRWPDTIISWTRAISGRFRDPLVGRDIMFGCGLGLATALLWKIGQLAPPFFGEIPRRPDWVGLNPLGSNRFAIGELLDVFVHAIVPALALLIILLLVSLLVKRFWITGIIVTALFMLLNLPEIEHWFDLFGIAVTLGLIVFSLVRLGLLSATVIFGVSRAVDGLVITSNLTHWWATGTIVTLGATLALAGYGFYVALADRPLIGSGWLEQ